MSGTRKRRKALWWRSASSYAQPVASAGKGPSGCQSGQTPGQRASGGRGRRRKRPHPSPHFGAAAEMVHGLVTEATVGAATGVAAGAAAGVVGGAVAPVGGAVAAEAGQELSCGQDSGGGRKSGVDGGALKLRCRPCHGGRWEGECAAADDAMVTEGALKRWRGGPLEGYGGSG